MQIDLTSWLQGAMKQYVYDYVTCLQKEPRVHAGGSAVAQVQRGGGGQGRHPARRDDGDVDLLVERC